MFGESPLVGIFSSRVRWSPLVAERDWSREERQGTRLIRYCQISSNIPTSLTVQHEQPNWLTGSVEGVKVGNGLGIGLGEGEACLISSDLRIDLSDCVSRGETHLHFDLPQVVRHGRAVA